MGREKKLKKKSKQETNIETNEFIWKSQWLIGYIIHLKSMLYIISNVHGAEV